MPFRYFDDFHEGEVIDMGSHFMSAEEIVEFAEEFDPIYFHLDAEAAKDSPLGGLTASGWHTCSATMRMMCDSFLLESSGQGAPGIDRCTWHNPVYAGSTLTGSAHVVSKRLSRSRPGIGLINFRFEFFVDGDKPVTTVENAIMFATRDFVENANAGDLA